MANENSNINMNFLRINIKYRLVNKKSWQQKILRVEDYFDLCQEEAAEIFSTPKYNHAVEYLAVPESNIGETRLEI